MRFAENESKRRIVGDGVESLIAFRSRHAGIFVSQPEIQCESRSYLPIVLSECVNGVVVIGNRARTGAAKSAVRAIGNEVIDERIERCVVPFTACSWQVGCGSNVFPAFDAKFESVLAANGGYGVGELINILDITLWSKAIRPNVATEFVNFHVREIRELARHGEIRTVQ